MHFLKNDLINCSLYNFMDANNTIQCFIKQVSCIFPIQMKSETRVFFYLVLHEPNTPKVFFNGIESIESLVQLAFVLCQQ